MISGDGVNLVLRADDGSNRTREVGKIVRCRDGLIYHAWQYDQYKRRDIDAIGVNRGVLALLRRREVNDVFLYFKQRNVTYQASVDLIEEYGTAGKPDIWGQNLNLPWILWDSVEPLTVPFIPKKVCIVVPRVPAIGEGSLHGSEQPAARVPAAVQAGLMEEAS